MQRRIILGLILAAGSFAASCATTRSDNFVQYQGAGLGVSATTTLPQRLHLTSESGRLPNAAIHHFGSVRALVFPASFGERLPAWSDSAIAYHLFGSHYSGDLRGTAGFLAQASGGRFRLEATVFPHLIDPDTPPESIGDAVLSAHAIQPFAEAVIRTWAKRANLAAYDNDGPDGHPMSGDDDGILDLPIIVVETDSTPALAHVPTNLTIPVGKDGRLSLRVGTIHVIALPRSGMIGDENRGLTTLLLGAMGLQFEEMYFPEDWPTPLSTLARVRLGWTSAAWAGRSDLYVVPNKTVLVVPIVDVADNRGLWLIERDGSQAYLTRVTRKADGHFATVDLRKFEPGEGHLDLPLSRGTFEEAPRARISWAAPDQDLTVDVVLSKRSKSISSAASSGSDA